MSCQQLIQEDPYIFTDTVSSNSTSFMHENNSQTKYVPLNRQTIYNRQFRQHEPKIVTSPTDSNNSSLKSTAYSDHLHNNHHHQINNRINPKERKQQHTTELLHSNGKLLSSRTSPKFFKSHQQNDDDDVKSNSINHSNSSVSKSKQNHDKSQQQQQYERKVVTVNNHASEALENGITGIKKEVATEEEEEDGEGDEEMGYEQALRNGIKEECEFKVIKTEEMKVFDYGNSSDEGKSKGTTTRKRGGESNKKKQPYNSRAFGPRNVIVEPISQAVPLVQLKLGVIDDGTRLLRKSASNGSEESSKLSRDERMSVRKMQLRHVLNQYKGINRFREISTERYKSQISKSFKFCKVMEREKQRILKRSVKTCSMDECKNEAIYSSDYCSKHILLTEKEQFLIRQCCFRRPDGQQCRIPVTNILATIAVCIDHQNAPAHQLIMSGNGIDSMEPKKSPIQRKRNNKASQLIRPVKKNGKGGRKKKMSLMTAQSNMILPAHRPTMIIHPSDLQKQSIKSSGNPPSKTLLPLKQENLHQTDSDQFIHFNSGNLLASSQSSYGSMSSGNEELYIKQDLMPVVCENSYESSEDTGVGGLSENELISHDVIDTFDMESCAELSKVLSSLPSNTLDDLLTEPLHASRDDEEYLDRAIEEVSASGMDQIAITAFEHLEGLDMLELDDDEQRQMISAATNLISMSSFLHDQDNNYSMPSPMMS